MAGAMLLLSDRPDVYADDNNLEGVKRSGPILFTVPGQLYDFDPRKSDNVIAVSADVDHRGRPRQPDRRRAAGRGLPLVAPGDRPAL